MERHGRKQWSAFCGRWCLECEGLAVQRGPHAGGFRAEVVKPVALQSAQQIVDGNFGRTGGRVLDGLQRGPSAHSNGRVDEPLKALPVANVVRVQPAYFRQELRRQQRICIPSFVQDADEAVRVFGIAQLSEGVGRLSANMKDGSTQTHLQCIEQA